jgi:hypothetical protein
MITKATNRKGLPINLYTDDTLTLAFDDWNESTPQSLAEIVSYSSLMDIRLNSEDLSEVSKASKALFFLASGSIK